MVEYLAKSYLNFWGRNYFFLILAHPVHKMWITQQRGLVCKYFYLIICLEKDWLEREWKMKFVREKLSKNAIY